jgi:hypothetical protein
LAHGQLRHDNQGLPDTHVGRVEGARAGAEEIQRVDDLLAQPHRQGLHGGEPGLPGRGCELKR